MEKYKLKLLMEETGCEQGEAELALELVNGDLEKAASTIGTLLKHVLVVKGRFILEEKNMYGMVCLLFNVKSRQILRLGAVFSYNPSVYENSEQMNWFSFERNIFACRIMDGSLPEYTQSFETALRVYIEQQADVFANGQLDTVRSTFEAFFGTEKTHALIALEQLNIAQFKHLDGAPHCNQQDVYEDFSDPGKIRIEVKIAFDQGGKPAKNIEVGDVVLSKITDTRDIAHYLANLIGTKRGGELLPMPAQVQKVESVEDEIQIELSYAPGVIGVAKVQSMQRLKVLDMQARPWWKKLMPWN